MRAAAKMQSLFLEPLIRTPRQRDHAPSFLNRFGLHRTRSETMPFSLISHTRPTMRDQGIARGSRGDHHQLFHVAGSGPKSRCKGIAPSTGRVMPVACEKRLPALCTQSATLSSVNNTDTNLTRQTQVLSGKAIYTGWRDKLSFRFLGIKYGTFPQRFTDSTPTIIDGEVDALDFGARCVSRDGRTGPVLGAEDCLFLNIYTSYMPIVTSKACSSLSWCGYMGELSWVVPHQIRHSTVAIWLLGAMSWW